MQTERFRESSCQHRKTALHVEKNLAAFLACHFGDLWAKNYCLAYTKNPEKFPLDFVKIHAFKFNILFYVDIFSVPSIVRTLKEDQPVRPLLNLLFDHFNRSEPTYKCQHI